MSAFSYCVKTTADSSWKMTSKEIFININDEYINYDIFDTDKSVICSNSTYLNNKNLSFDINKLNINE